MAWMGHPVESTQAMPGMAAPDDIERLERLPTADMEAEFLTKATELAALTGCAVLWRGAGARAGPGDLRAGRHTRRRRVIGRPRPARGLPTEG